MVRKVENRKEKTQETTLREAEAPDSLIVDTKRRLERLQKLS